MAAGLAYLHGQSITHRDLKPANLLRVGKAWKISDFGIARQMGSQTGTLTQSISGTPLYMPPEAYTAQVQNTAVKVAPAWDMWSFGVMAAQLLTGELPFDGLGDILQGKVAVKGKVSPPFDAIVRGCLQQNPAQRLSASQVLEALQEKKQAPATPNQAPPKVQVTHRRETVRPASSPAPAKPSVRSWTLQAKIEFEEVISEGFLGFGRNTRKRRNAVAIEMVELPAGRFLMGSPDGEGDSDERPQHWVNVPAFSIGKYPITQAQYEAVMGTNPSYFKGADRPVEQVSWHEAKAFCQKLSQQTGKIVRLPSEAEWEYACRAGTTTPFSFGENLTTNQANYDGNYPYGNVPKGKYREETTKVGSFPANGFGLYDMHGNVWEWCEDVWHENYSSTALGDPGAPSDGSAWVTGGDSTRRVLRGGSWFIFASFCRSAYRSWDATDNWSNSNGFRVVLSSS